MNPECVIFLIGNLKGRWDGISASERALTLHLEGTFAIVFFANVGGLRKAFDVRMINALGGSLSGI